ncbi:MAG: DUF11 domain-containing protein [Myxococcales bacterium]|nr:DUF11 domain-containing protein [Myxococcales bacterium]
MTTRHWLGLGIGAAGMLLASQAALAAPQLRLQVDQKGDFVLIGNTLGHECAGGTPAPVVGTVGNCGANLGDSAPDVFWRSEAPGAGQAQANNTITLANARSTALLTVPPGATVTHAFLYWGGNAVGGDNTAVLDRPGGFTQNVTALQTHIPGVNDAYQSVADVTSLVQANGSGTYRVSGVTTTSFVDANNNNIFAGWWMVVIYDRPADPPRNIALFDGLDPVSNGAPQNTNLTGFLVPPVFSNAKLGVVTFEGDNTLVGDQFSFDGVFLTNGQNPVNNFFNGTRSFLGNPVSVAGDLPQLTGTAGSMSGMDMDVVDVTPQLVAGQTSAPIVASSSGDVYYLAGFVTSIPTFKPDFTTSQKSANDLNGGSLVAGDTIEYTLTLVNTGNDTAINTVLNDALPVGVTYVPGTLAITAGQNAGAKTDAVADDQCEYVGATRTVTCRLGSGANGTQGGQVGIGESSTVVFRVAIDAGFSGTISNQGIVTAGGLLGSPPENTPTDGNGPANGSPPTDVVVDACLTDADCSAPTPHCDTSVSPKICVECLVDAHCPGNLPTCDPVANVCVCIPSGAEICDGVDNDCNGTVDDGFNVGGACTAGVGACQTSGNIVCSAGSAVCNAVPGTPGTEVCSAVDEDCDGNLNNGNPGGGVACATGLAGVCAAGTTNCNVATNTLDCVPGILPGTQTETCNALDDDCDGTADDGFNVGQPCTVGVGACEASGTMECTGPNSSACNAVPGTPGTEVCGNAVDEDCDGSLTNGCLDTDGDGLLDDDEVQGGTDPLDADSDDDGAPDGQEVDWNQDTDGDGLINALDPDSDNEGLFDGTEMGLDCSNPDTDVSQGHCVPDADDGATTTDPLDADTDDGGVSDGNEDTNLDGAIDAGELDPNDPSDDVPPVDTDGDGLSDDYEGTIGTDPTDADSDDDGLLDGGEPNPNQDTDGDGLINALDPDSDNDGLFDGTEAGLDCSNPDTDAAEGNCTPDADQGATTTEVLISDTDDGGASDGSEDCNLDGAVDPGETDPNNPGDDGTIIDTDGDGLSDCAEATIGTDPNDQDTDNDGVIDGLEPNPADDTDGDGLINALDPDSDDDGLFDGTEMGLDCTNPDTDPAEGNCIPDADDGATTTNPLDADTDDGGVTDGDEDTNHNGMIDPGERDPNDPLDDFGGNGGGGAGGTGGGGGAPNEAKGGQVLRGGGGGCTTPGATGDGGAVAALGLGARAMALRRRRRAA